MQFTKDSFYMALLERLVSLDPNLTVTLNGTTRPAIIAAENELIIPVEPLPNAFYIEWGMAQMAKQPAGGNVLMEMECMISYHTLGTVESGVDRGRTLGALDLILLNICQPPMAPKRDYSQSPSADLGTNIVWSLPVLGKVSGSQAPAAEGLPRGTTGVRLERSASLKVFFFPEVAIS